MKKTSILILVLISLILIGGGLLMGLHFLKNNNQETPKTKEELLEEKGIKLVSKETFLEEVDTLLAKGYSVTEINNIYEYLSDQNIKEVLLHPYTDLTNFYQISNFDFGKIERYLAYQAMEGLSMTEAVTRVNINLDLPFYSEITNIEDASSITVLVNKSHALASDYVPADLVNIPSFPNLKIRNVAVNDFENLLAAATLANVHLIPYSTYRSYDYQKGLYEKYLKRDPQDVVDTYSARPGHSEHQTGLALDIRSSTLGDNLTTADYEWMQNNSYLYGFIIRYPKGNSTITGYKEEPWHIRYIGIDLATKVHNLGLTYDEYYDIYLTQH